MLYPELPNAFPWYDQLKKQNRYRENTAGMVEYGLLNPSDSLLPFQFYIIGGGGVVSWEIYHESGALVATISGGSFSFIRIANREGRKYYSYAGQVLTVAGGGFLNLAPGFYYSKIVMSHFGVVYSEIFQVPGCQFTAATMADNPFLRIEWYNDTDLKPIFYNDYVSTTPYFKNTVYLDSFIHVSEPAITEDAEKDGEDEPVATFQKAVVSYKIADLVPDFLKVALGLLQMHDHVIITTAKSIRTGEVKRISMTATPTDGGAFSNIELTWREEIAAIKKGANDNMV